MMDDDISEIRNDEMMTAEQIFIGLKMDDNVSSNAELAAVAMTASRVFHDFATHYIQTGELKKVC
jgi:hypothetical protein